MLDLTSRTAFELHAEIQALKRALASLKGRVRQLEQRRVQPPVIADRPRVKDIVSMVAAMAGQSPMAIIGEQRDRDVVRARQVICWLARRFTRHSLMEVARALDRDHTTALHSVKRINAVAAALACCPAKDTPEAWAELLLSADPWPRP
jgi:chromosomal replication initiation ATPase DnaA